jgi:hypothetical protein
MSQFSAFWDSLAQDLQYGWRMLIARPAFTAVAVLSIALGIGATTAIFSVIHAVLMDPYPYRAADRIAYCPKTRMPTIRLGSSQPFKGWALRKVRRRMIGQS